MVHALEILFQRNIHLTSTGRQMRSECCGDVEIKNITWRGMHGLVCCLASFCQERLRFSQLSFWQLSNYREDHRSLRRIETHFEILQQKTSRNGSYRLQTRSLPEKQFCTKSLLFRPLVARHGKQTFLLHRRGQRYDEWISVTRSKH